MGITDGIGVAGVEVIVLIWATAKGVERGPLAAALMMVGVTTIVFPGACRAQPLSSAAVAIPNTRPSKRLMILMATMLSDHGPFDHYV